MPLRHELIPQIRARWSELSDAPIKRVTLHYLRDSVTVELHLPLNSNSDINQIRQCEQEMKQLFADDSVIGTINVVMEFAP